MELPTVHIDARSLMMAIRAVRETVRRLEESLPSVPASEREALIALLVSYDEAAEALERAYVAELRRAGGDHLPVESVPRLLSD